MLFGHLSQAAGVKVSQFKKFKYGFSSKTFVLTGSLSKLTREDAGTEIENRGGKVTSSVSKKTDVVIVGENPGSKYDKAKELNIEIWTEKEFIDKLTID